MSRGGQIRQDRARHLSERLLAAVEDIKGHDAATSNGEPRYLTRLAVRSGGRVRFLKTDEIDWFEAADYYVKLHVGGKSHLLRETMSRLKASSTRSGSCAFTGRRSSTWTASRSFAPTRMATTSLLHDGTSLKVSRTGRERLDELLR